MISVQKNYGQYVLKPTGIWRTTEEDIEEMICKCICEECSRRFPYWSSLATHQRLHCKRIKRNCPDISSLLAIRKHDDQGRYHWHLYKVVRVNNRAEMRVSVEYYDGTTREALKWHEEKWGIISCRDKWTAPSRERSAADRLVKSMKKKAAQNPCDTAVSLGKRRRKWNANLTVLHLKCLRRSRAEPSRKKPEILL